MLRKFTRIEYFQRYFSQASVNIKVSLLAPTFIIGLSLSLHSYSYARQIQSQDQAQSQLQSTQSNIIQSLEPTASQTIPDSLVAQGSVQQGPVLRLEDTIRGNKEQPQVLTIVPWQLPVHQRINENKEWQPQTTSLASIERGAFLRSLAVVDEINANQSALELKVENKDLHEPELK